jgi:hypothetical protein
MYSMSPYLPLFKNSVKPHPPPLNRARHQISSHAQQFYINTIFIRANVAPTSIVRYCRLAFFYMIIKTHIISDIQQFSLEGIHTQTREYSTWTGDGHFPLYIQWGWYIRSSLLISYQPPSPPPELRRPPFHPFPSKTSEMKLLVLFHIAPLPYSLSAVKQTSRTTFADGMSWNSLKKG